MMNDLAGRTVKGYEVIERIGGGGFGDVYRANQPLLKREVAIKIIRPEYANNLEYIRRFETEAQMVARLDHLHIVPLYDYWRDPTGAYLVMRWLRGGSLRTSLNEHGPWPLERALRLMEQIGAALTVAHRQGVIHRDVKSDNILLDEEGNGYLGDFGIAKDLAAHSLTQSSPIIGSPDYMSPEQIQGDALTPQADIYSLGIVLYEMLTGAKPFSATTLAALMNKHLNEPTPPLRAARPNLPESIDTVIQRATQKLPADRYQNPLDMVTDFRRAASVSSETGSPTVMGVDDGPTITPSADVRVSFTPGIQNPYKGLAAFEQADAQDFYGREHLVEQLIARMTTPGEWSRFLAVVGPSGSGKSSVIKAGVIPTLRQGGLTGSQNWFYVEIEPRTHPLEQLETALLRVAVNPPAELMTQLKADKRGLLRAVHRVLPADGSDLVLFIDQFEEVFTLVEDDEERSHFLDSLLTAVTDPDSRLRVIITLRADFFDRPLLKAEFGALFRQRYEVVMPLNDEELRRAIIAPAERVGLMLEAGLAEAIIGDISGQSSALPLLQYALSELYTNRDGIMLTLKAYRDIGRADGAMVRRAEQTYAELDLDAQKASRQLFLRLVVPGEGTEDTRRRVSQAEIASLSEDEQAMERAVEAFGKHRLLTFDRDPVTRVPTVEVAHEALIRTWARLFGWLDSNRDDLRTQRRLMMKAEEWRHRGRDDSELLRDAALAEFQEWSEKPDSDVALTRDEREYLEASIAAAEREARRREAEQQERLELQQKALRRARIAVIVLAAGLLAAFGLGAVALNQGQIAQENAATAVAAQGEAVAQAAEAATAQNVAESEARAAATAQQVAIEQAATATQAQGIAEIQATVAANEAATAAAARLIAEEQATIAAQARGVAEVQATLAANEAAEAAAARLVAEEQAAIATQAQGIAEIQATVAANEAAEAAAARLVAEEQAATAAAALLEAERNAEESQSRALAGGARAALRRNQPDLAVALALEAMAIPEPPAEAQEALFDAASSSGIRNRFYGHDNWVNSAAFSPDGLYAISGSDDQTLILWDVTSGDIVQRLSGGYPERIYRVDFSPDGQHVVAGYYDGTVVLWDVESGTEINRLGEGEGHTDWVTALAFSPDGRYVLSGSLDQSAYLWDIENDRLTRLPGEHGDTVRAVAFNRDGNIALTASGNGDLYLWNLVTPGGEITYERLVTGKRLSVADFSPDGQTALVGSFDNSISFWDVRTGVRLHESQAHSSDVYSAAFSPDGRFALSGSRDTFVYLWDVSTGRPLRRFEGHASTIGSVDFSPDGRFALTGSFDNTLILWDVGIDLPLRTLQWHTNEVSSVAFSPDGLIALSGDHGGLVILWDTVSGEALRTLRGHDAGVLSVEISPDGSTALSGGFDRAIIHWDLTNGTAIRRFTLAGHTSEIESLAFTPDGSMFVSASRDGTIVLWDVQDGAVVRRFEGHQGNVNAVDFSADGQRLVSASGDNTVRVWDVNNGALVWQGGEHAALVSSVAFSPDTSKIISGSFDSTLILWDAATGRVIRQLQGHNGLIHSVEFSPDSRLVLSTSHDNTSILWDVETGAPLQRWYGHSGFVFDAAFSPDGERVITGSQDNNLLVWQVPQAFGSWIEYAYANRYAAELSCQQRLTYGLPPCDAQGQPPTRVPLPTAAATSTPAHTATPTLTPSPTAISPAQMVSYVDSGLTYFDIPPGVGSLAARADRLVVDLTGEDNQIREEFLSGSYTNFLVGATIEWGPGADDDYCGFKFRMPNAGNGHAILLAQDYSLGFHTLADNTWDGSWDDVDTTLNIGAGVTNDLILLVAGDAFSVYLNGVYIDQYTSDLHPSGRVAVAGGTFDNSDETRCIFSDIWVYDLVDYVPVYSAPLAAYVADALQTLNIPLDSGELVEEVAETVVDLTGETNLYRWENLSEDYTDFVLGATIEWGPGAAEDQCGFRLRDTSNANAYVLNINRENVLSFEERTGGQWITAARQYGDGSAIRTNPDEVNELVVVGIGDTFTVYINSQYAAQFTNNTHANGRVALLAGTDDGSDETWCTFRNAWVWRLNAGDVMVSVPPSPTPTLAPSPEVTATPQPAIVQAVQVAGLDVTSGYVAAQLDSYRIDLTGETNLYRWYLLDGSYTNFVLGTTFNWGPGEPEDQCGARFRHTDGDNAYVININRENVLRFAERTGGQWISPTQFGDGSTIRTGATETNEMVIVGIGDTFTVFINGQYADQFQSSTHSEGRAGLLAGTDENSDETWCEFRDSWVWALPVGAEPLPVQSVMTALAAAGISQNSGYIAAQISSEVIDLTGLTNRINAVRFPGEYGDFVTGATIAWGPGAAEDYCGFYLRRSADGVYKVQIDREGYVEFRKFADQWLDQQQLLAPVIDRAQDATNQLMVVASGAVITVYINGEYVAQYEDNAYRRGSVELIGGTYEQSDESSCTFTDAWVWELTTPVSAGPTATPTSVPTLTPSPTTAPAVLPTGLNEGLALAGIRSDSGRLGATLDEIRIDNSGEENIIRSQMLAGVYDNFVMGTTFNWGPGAADDECGLRFRSDDEENYYTIGVNREGTIFFLSRLDSQWTILDSVESALIRTEPTAINTLVLAGVGSRFDLYINGGYAGQMIDDQLSRGEVGVAATTFAGSDDSWCDFTNSWVWELTETVELSEPTSLPAHVQAGLLLAGVDTSQGVLDAQLAQAEISTTSSGFDSAPLGTDSYTDVVVGTTIIWGPGGTDDQCGLTVRDTDAGFYNFWIDRAGVAGFESYDGEWQPTQTGDGRDVRLGEGATNTLVLAASGNVFSLFVNGELAGKFTDAAFASGGVRLALYAFTGAGQQSSCTFTDAWVWAMP